MQKKSSSGLHFQWSQAFVVNQIGRDAHLHKNPQIIPPKIISADKPTTHVVYIEKLLRSFGQSKNELECCFTFLAKQMKKLTLIINITQPDTYFLRKIQEKKPA